MVARHCHCGSQLVIAGLTRNPVHAYHWIPDQVRDDNCRDRDDNGRDRDDNCRDRDDNGSGWDAN